MIDYLDDNLFETKLIDRRSNGFKFQDYVCNSCHDLTMICLNISGTAMISVKEADYRCIIHEISKSEPIHLSKKSMFHDCGYIYKMHIQ